MTRSTWRRDQLPGPDQHPPDGPPQDAIPLQDLIDLYERENPSKPRSKSRCVDVFKSLMKQSGAKTLDELTGEKLMEFRATIEKSIPAASTRVWTYGQIKSILSFAMKCGKDPQQIRAAQDRCKVLWTSNSTVARPLCLTQAFPQAHRKSPFNAITLADPFPVEGLRL